MTNMTQFTFRSTDGVTELHARQWISPDSAPRAVVQLVHGVSEHISRYDPFARFLAEHGFVVAGHDHLGHGDSLPRGGTPIYFRAQNGWTTATDDVYSLHRLLRQKYPTLPCFILGHSMGSFLTRSLLIRYGKCADGAILMGSGWNSSAAIAGGTAATAVMSALKGKRATSRLITSLAFGGYNKPFTPNRTAFDWIAADEKAVDRYIADPKCGEDATIGLFADIVGGFGFNQNRENLQKMDKSIPILFISGADDPVGAMGRGVEKCRDAFLSVGMEEVSLILYPGLRHEILNESCAGDTVYPDLLHWLEAHLS